MCKCKQKDVNHQTFPILSTNIPKVSDKESEKQAKKTSRQRKELCRDELILGLRVCCEIRTQPILAYAGRE